MTFKAAETKGSLLEISVASTFLVVPGIQNVTPDPGENKTWDDSDITSDYETLRAAHVGGGGSVAFSKHLDPLDPVDQALHAIFNNGGVNVADNEPVAGRVTLGSTAVVWGFTGVLTKYAPKGEKAVGWMVDGEIKLSDRMLLNEAA